jgi:hypothetical protein
VIVADCLGRAEARAKTAAGKRGRAVRGESPHLSHRMKCRTAADDSQSAPAHALVDEPWSFLVVTVSRQGLGASHVQRDGLTAEGHGSRREEGGSRRPLAHAGPPFGSEMGWGSTGQEEIYGGTKYFGGSDTAQVGLNAILGYMPKVPYRDHDGCARRHWDFLYGAPETERLEWMIRHYGSNLDAMREYRDYSIELYLSRIGYGRVESSRRSPSTPKRTRSR